MFAEPQAIVGRAEELRNLGEFLDGIEAGPIGLVLEGELGIGKTALWKAGLATAGDRSYRVLVCRPIESETRLAYAGLGDLLADVPEEALGDLPGPQRQALEVALLRKEPEGSRRSGQWRWERWGCSVRSPSNRRSSSASMTCSGSIRSRRMCLRSFAASEGGADRCARHAALGASRCGCRRSRAGLGGRLSGPGTAGSRRPRWIVCWSHVSMRACRSDRWSAFTIDPAVTPSSRSRSAGRCSSARISPIPTTSRSPRACTSSFATGSRFCLEQLARQRRSRRRCCGQPWS